jgi:hypothetical protein
MTVREFQNLSEKEQEKLIFKDGVLVGTREKAILDIRLYQVQSFYVELYHHRHFNVNVKIRAFTNTNYLSPYFRKGDVNELFAAISY